MDIFHLLRPLQNRQDSIANVEDPCGSIVSQGPLGEMGSPGNKGNNRIKGLPGLKGVKGDQCFVCAIGSKLN